MDFREDDHQAVPDLFGLGERVYRHIDEEGTSLGGDLYGARERGLGASQGLGEGALEPGAQLGPGHRQDVPVGLARGGLQEATGAPADVDDIALGIGEHRRRRAKAKMHRLEPGREVRASNRARVDPVIGVERGEKIGEGTDRFGASEEEAAVKRRSSSCGLSRAKRT